MSLPRQLPVESGSVLIAAISGRALAQAARASGYRPLVADFFADEDTRAAAAACERLPGDFAGGFHADTLVAALDRLAVRHRPIALVCGSGFEQQSDLHAMLDKRFGLAGNKADTVLRTKRVEEFAVLCRTLDIPHPECRRLRPKNQTGWLSKLEGAAGGWHVVPAAEAPDDPRRYFQRRVTGRPVSAMFLADGKHAEILGFSRQWSAPIPGHLYRYGGAVRPAHITRQAEQAMRTAVEKLVASLGLVGLNSADFLVAAHRINLLEINARPGATLDIYRDHEGRLFEAHLQACEGMLPRKRLKLAAAAASTILYTERGISNFRFSLWPDWVHDRQGLGTSIPPNGPVCTVTATAKSARAAIAMLRGRMRSLAMLTEDVAA